MLGGYAHRIARIDLSTGQVEYFAPDPKDLEMYVGGRGLGVKYVFENGPQVDPLGPENLLCIMNGPLSGTRAKMSGRLAVVTKSPLTGTVTDSHMGGWTAAKLKWAGFDGLLIKGASEKPVYLLVKDGQVSIHDASDLWGKTTHETCRILRERHGKEADVMAIGPAGENLVRFANWINNDERAAGRGGTGAVGGSKKLKAIVVVGTHDKMPQPKDPELWKEADRLASATINDPKNVTAPKKGGLSLYGTNVLMNITNVMGALPTFNAQHTCIEGAEKISGEYIREHRLIKDNTCHACPVACKKMVEVHINGKTIRFESYEYESAWALGAHSGHTDTDWTGYAIYLCNAYGMDTIEAGNAIAVLMEATEKGYYQGEDGIRFGDKEGEIRVLEAIAYRKGVGDMLAEGPARFAKAIGHPEIALEVKGQSIPAYDPRGLKGMGIAYATSNRGACHLRAYTPASEILGVPYKTDPLAWEGKGKLTKLFQDLSAFTDSLDLCKFSQFAEGPEEYAKQLAAYWGRPVTPEEILRIGERIYNLERYYNNLAGWGEGSDYLPERFLKEPSDCAGSKGQVTELDRMLEEYYRERGWERGVVPPAKLQELGILSQAADD
ncbi:aldehyde ferredoxin oxidoreductase C-terminal domain-containing protein [Thermus thermophilus]|uniref:aldehyde ferredoxin oxidoreductase C-terminal domain-containing protein n=1 Tax=Thermus thermophilus TaxID=274 RepID=UPI0013FE2A3F|nr:aldehyde ferredoxin oxidoreductase family protein [Thermus thermophilus]